MDSVPTTRRRSSTFDRRTRNASCDGQLLAVALRERGDERRWHGRVTALVPAQIPGRGPDPLRDFSAGRTGALAGGAQQRAETRGSEVVEQESYDAGGGFVDVVHQCSIGRLPGLLKVPAKSRVPTYDAAVTSELDLRHIEIHGHRVGYRTGGSGPVIVLIHGMAGSSATWRYVLPALAERFTVVAPDLVGHGESEKPRGDYSLGSVRERRARSPARVGPRARDLVGQSLGGGVAMQFAYQFPERSERLVLVSSGGLGDEVNLLLRLLALPGASSCSRSACNNWVHDAGVACRGLARRRRTARRPAPRARCGRATDRWPTPRRAPRSCTRCDPSSTSAASA